MTVRQAPPVHYRRWDGTRGAINDPGQWPWPTVHLPVETDGWRHLGWAPRPRTRWQAARHHWHHGRLMGYPRRHVAAWILLVDILARKETG